MTTNPGEIQRKVRQLENDIEAIYDMLSTIGKNVSRQGAHLSMFEGRVNDRFDLVDERFDGIDARLGGLETQISGLSDLIREGR